MNSTAEKRPRLDSLIYFRPPNKLAVVLVTLAFIVRIMRGPRFNEYYAARLNPAPRLSAGF